MAKKVKTVNLKGMKRIPGTRKIINDVLPSFSRQLSAMLNAGLPIVTALETLKEQADHPSFKAVLQNVQDNIENGSSFSESLLKFPTIFDTLYINMVRSGEQGGQLAETTARLASFLEDSARLKRKVKSAMMYPVIVLCLAFAIAILLIVFVVPKFGEMFQDFGANLPGPTQMLLDLSDFLQIYGIFVLAAIVVAVFLFKKWKATPAGGYKFDEFALKAPVFGIIIQKVASARFARTFAELMASGVPILNALDIVSGATGNKVAGKVILDAKDVVEKGEPLSVAMLKQTVFPLMLVRMLQAGEKTGRIEEMLNSIADFYEDEVETTLDGLTSLLEPLLMIFLGLIIGSIVVAMFLPIFKLGEVVSG
jgi:type IV pilus assembly protein PilC